jgi:Domain of unknown function (DUF4124)
MRMRYGLSALLAFLFGTMGTQPAYADIYTWLDANGSINVSNLTPPDGAHVTSVMHESAPRVVPAAEAMRQADVQALAQRVQQLEGELAMAQYQQPPPQAYAVMQPPVVQYFVDASSPQFQYNSTGPSGCDSGWGDCGNNWWNAGIFPVGVVFLQAPRFKRFPPMREGRQFAVKPPMQGGGGSRRG